MVTLDPLVMLLRPVAGVGGGRGRPAVREGAPHVGGLGARLGHRRQLQPGPGPQVRGVGGGGDGAPVGVREAGGVPRPARLLAAQGAEEPGGPPAPPHLPPGAPQQVRLPGGRGLLRSRRRRRRRGRLSRVGLLLFLLLLLMLFSFCFGSVGATRFFVFFF